METSDIDTLFMQKAIDQAKIAFNKDEVPIGAIITQNNKIIGKGHNQTEGLIDVTAHAEMIAITAASSSINNKFLNECTLYVTIEPCVMCAGAIKNARFKRIVIGSSEPKTGFTKFLSPEFSSKSEIVFGILESECKQLMQDFFISKR
ncbi:MAG: nucleoside deaminase [Bacteroidia bacterium]